MKHPSGTFYRHILADAWQTVKKNRALWVLGFFVSFLGNGGVYELLVQGTGRLGLSEDFGAYLSIASLLPAAPTAGSALAALGPVGTGFAALIAVTLAALIAVAIWVIVSAQGGLIVGLREGLKGKPRSFVQLFSAGAEAFKSLLALNIISRVAIMAIFYLLLALMLLLLTDATLLTSSAFLLGFLVFIPITIVIGFVTVYAACYVTLQRLPFVQALSSALALFKRYWLVSLETALILFAINVLVALGLSLAFGAIGFALLPLAFGATLLQSGSGMIVLVAMTVILGVALIAAVGSGLAAFQYAVWVNLFNKLHVRGHGGRSKIVRWLERFLK